MTEKQTTLDNGLHVGYWRFFGRCTHLCLTQRVRTIKKNKKRIGNLVRFPEKQTMFSDHWNLEFSWKPGVTDETPSLGYTVLKEIFTYYLSLDNRLFKTGILQSSIAMFPYILNIDRTILWKAATNRSCLKLALTPPCHNYLMYLKMPKNVFKALNPSMKLNTKMF